MGTEAIKQFGDSVWCVTMMSGIEDGGLPVSLLHSCRSDGGDLLLNTEWNWLFRMFAFPLLSVMVSPFFPSKGAMPGFSCLLCFIKCPKAAVL